MKRIVSIIFYWNEKQNNIITCLLLSSLVGYFTMSLSFPIQEISARCPNGYHKSPSGDCEKVTDTKGMPRCPNGYHRSPDGDCEQVNEYNFNGKSSKNDDDFNDDDKHDFDFTNTKNNENDNGKKDDSLPPLNQIFGMSGDDNDDNENDYNKYEQSEEKNQKDKNEYREDEIELKGKVTYVVDGDTLDINDIRIRLSLVDTPERGQNGYKEAKNFVKDICLDKKGEVDIDDGQRRGDRYGREVGLVYCDGININKELMENNFAKIYTEYCNISEFKNEKWAKPYC